MTFDLPRPQMAPAKAEPLLRPFMPELDTLRGIAVLAVVFLHGFYWRYGSSSFGPWIGMFMSLTRFGWTGVNLFFVLSGFLITGILLDSKNTPHYYRRFYTRRALRILPAYYALLILLLLFRTSSYSFVGLSFVYLANMTDFFGVPCAYGPLWSLAVEEHFYILWPTIVRQVTRRNLALVSASILIGEPVARGVAFAMGHGGAVDWYTWFVADGLAAGSLLAVLLRTGVSRHSIRALSAGLIASAILLGAAGAPFGIGTRSRLLGAALQMSIVNVLAAGILLLFLLVGTGRDRSFVTLRPLRWLGYLSYGLYLDHILAFRIYDRLCERYFPQIIARPGDFALVSLRFTLSGGAATALAYLSRRYFEERFLRLKDAMVPKSKVSEGVALGDRRDPSSLFPRGSGKVYIPPRPEELR
jgi:peptidoglycan/LPS O-acetylase OafA/YrhL